MLLCSPLVTWNKECKGSSSKHSLPFNFTSTIDAYCYLEHLRRWNWKQCAWWDFNSCSWPHQNTRHHTSCDEKARGCRSTAKRVAQGTLKYQVSRLLRNALYHWASTSWVIYLRDPSRSILLKSTLGESPQLIRKYPRIGLFLGQESERMIARTSLAENMWLDRSYQIYRYNSELCNGKSRCIVSRLV